MKKKYDFSWNVWVWDFNKDCLESYDVGYAFSNALGAMRKKDLPSTRKEFDGFLKSEAMYRFWSKCEYEMNVSSIHADRPRKVDVYSQLKMNWQRFSDYMWSVYTGE